MGGQMNVLNMKTRMLRVLTVTAFSPWLNRVLY